MFDHGRMLFLSAGDDYIDVTSPVTRRPIGGDPEQAKPRCQFHGDERTWQDQGGSCGGIPPESRPSSTWTAESVLEIRHPGVTGRRTLVSQIRAVLSGLCWVSSVRPFDFRQREVIDRHEQTGK